MLEFCNTVPAALKGEADHRIANNLAMLASLIRLHAREVARRERSLSPAEVARLLHELCAKVETVARLHRALALAGTDRVPIATYVRELCDTVASLSPSTQTSVSTACEQHVAGARALPVGFIVAEMMANAIKYAHPTGIPVLLNVTCTQAGDTSICIEVSDDGIGLPERFDPSTDGGLGFKLMRALAQQVGGELDFTSSPLGTTCRLVLPPEPDLNASVSLLHDRTPRTHQEAVGS
ncbi:MAG TPA: sensor histidine kinase [Gemmatimonadaceae bacterium]|jgi:two-component sensor histidine kinase|nr:sensor histidine kinase [Gemmatimonadaceae bacterium]